MPAGLKTGATGPPSRLTVTSARARSLALLLEELLLAIRSEDRRHSGRQPQCRARWCVNATHAKATFEADAPAP